MTIKLQVYIICVCIIATSAIIVDYTISFESHATTMGQQYTQPRKHLNVTRPSEVGDENETSNSVETWPTVNGLMVTFGPCMYVSIYYLVSIIHNRVTTCMTK